jgi:hypothetical protein
MGRNINKTKKIIKLEINKCRGGGGEVASREKRVLLELVGAVPK